MNINKAQTLIFSKSHNIRARQKNISIDGNAIETVNYTKFLEVVIDNKLNWSAHIKYICNKMSNSMGSINKVRNLLNKDTLLNLYYVFIYPYITYCSVIWGRAPNIYLLKVHTLQKRVLRIISHHHHHELSDVTCCRLTDSVVTSRGGPRILHIAFRPTRSWHIDSSFSMAFMSRRFMCMSLLDRYC